MGFEPDYRAGVVHNTCNLRIGVVNSAATLSPIIHVIIVHVFHSLNFHSFSNTHCIAHMIITGNK